MGITGTDKALMFAIGGIMRGGASRGAYHSGAAFITIGGINVGTIRDDPDVKVLDDSLTISDVLDETPNTCAFTVMGMQPAIGAEIIVTLGSIRNTRREFAGVVLALDGGYEGLPKYGSVGVHGIDYTFLANGRLVLARYQTQSATAIAQDLMARNTLGFTVMHVQANLPVVDEITFTNQEVASALTALAKRIGAYWFIDYYRDLHFFLEESTTESPDPLPITPDHYSLVAARATTDLSQVISDVLVEGGGSTALVDCAPGATQIPVADDVWYPPSGVVVSGPQRIAYTALLPGGVGALIGTTETPSVQPGVLIGPSSGPGGVPPTAGVTAGLHRYAYSWVTAAGETPPSPLSGTVFAGPIAPPAEPAIAYNIRQQYRTSDEWNGWAVGDVVEWLYNYGTTADGPAYATVPSGSCFVTAEANTYGSYYHSSTAPSPWAMRIRLRYSPDPRVDRIFVWCWVRGGLYGLGITQNWVQNNPAYALENGGYGYVDYDYSSIFYQATFGYWTVFPSANPIFGRVALSGLAAGPAGAQPVTSRRIYRTAAGGSQLKLLGTIADNTTTSAIDTAADSALGANAPTVNTAGIPTQEGIVKAGATFVPVTGTGPFLSGGGWARSGNMIFRYTAVGSTGVTLATALVSSLNYGVNITTLPALVVPPSGAGAIQIVITAGDQVNVLAHAEDLSLSAYLASILGGDGLLQAYFQDGRLSYAEALARAQAHLNLQSHAQVSVNYVCRDRHTRSGRSVTVDLETPLVSGIFKIQQVTIANFHHTILPTYTVNASSNRVSFEDLLRSIRQGVQS